MNDIVTQHLVLPIAALTVLASATLGGCSSDETVPFTPDATTTTTTGSGGGGAGGDGTGGTGGDGAGGTGGDGTGGDAAGGAGGVGGEGGGQGGAGGAGGCASCSQVWGGNAEASDLCTDGDPSSADLYADAYDCACVTCTASCGDNLCMGNTQNVACTQCLAQNSCNAAIAACVGDI